MRKQPNKHGPPACMVWLEVFKCMWAYKRYLRKQAATAVKICFYTSGIPPGNGGLWSDFCVYRGRSKLSKLLIDRLLRANNHILLSLNPLVAFTSFMPKMGPKMKYIKAYS